jgi:hypothetical protein
MSSRLLTMKFMQRAAASSPQSVSGSPTPAESSDAPPYKRQRVESSASLTGFDVNELADAKAVKEALALEEEKRQKALDRAAREAGDTRWVLNFEDRNKGQKKQGLRVVSLGSFAEIDRSPAPRTVVKVEREEEVGDSPVMAGRRSFGKFNRKLEKAQRDPDGSSSDSSSDEDSESEDEDGDNIKYEDGESDDEDDPTAQLLRDARQEAARKAKEDRMRKKKEEKAELKKLAALRKKKDVKLNTLTSISGGNASKSGGSKGMSDMECYNCGKKGHPAKDCPQPRSNKRKSFGNDDRNGKRRKSS